MTERAASIEEIRIKALLEAWADAVRRHDVPAILAASRVTVLGVIFPRSPTGILVPAGRALAIRSQMTRTLRSWFLVLPNHFSETFHRGQTCRSIVVGIGDARMCVV